MGNGARNQVDELIRALGGVTETPAILEQAIAQSMAGNLVQADHVGGLFPRPPLRNRRRVDLEVDEPNGRKHLIEFERESSLGRQHSQEQARDLSTFARADPNVDFRVLVVPEPLPQSSVASLLRALSGH